MSLLTQYWPVALIGTLAAFALLYFLLRPRQRVTLTDSAPIRPHMGVAKKNAPAIGLTATAAGAILSPHTRDPLVPPSGPPDDLAMLKGVGPKLAALLNTHGIVRFDQIASLSPTQVDDLDKELGVFRGRLSRDHVVDQADYLARGDVDGFEQQFGKL